MTDNGDGTFTDEDGNVVFEDGSPVPDSFYTGEDPPAEDPPAEDDSEGWVDNEDGTWTSPDGTVMKEDGTLVDDSYYTGEDPPAEDDGTWTDNGDDTWTYTAKNGSTQIFGSDGTLTDSYDADGKSNAGMPGHEGDVEYTTDPETGLPIRIDNNTHKVTNARGDDDYTIDPETGLRVRIDRNTNKVSNANDEAPIGGGSILDKLKKPDGSLDLDKIKKLIPLVGGGLGGLAALFGQDKGSPKGLYNGTVDMNRNRDTEFAAMHDKMGTRQYPVGIAALGGGTDKAALMDGPGTGLKTRLDKDGMVTTASEPLTEKQKEDTFRSPPSGGDISLVDPRESQGFGPGDMPVPDIMNMRYRGEKIPENAMKAPFKLSEGQIAHGVGGEPLVAAMVPEMSKDEWLASLQQHMPKAMAEGGIAQAFARGGPTKPRYLRGETDGMADQIKARIDGGQEARLAHGEFVIPADVVSHLGNGNSDAGAKKLYAMMDKLRVARTGNKKQGRQINPDKFLPGMAGRKMASGGITDVVPRFSEGGVTPTTSGLAEWAGPYVTNMLSEANALGNNMVSNPQNFVYQGPRSAGASALQTQGFNAAGSLGVNSNLTNAATQVTGIGDKMKGMTYDPTKFDSTYKPADPYETTKFASQEFTGDQVSKYMNPYLQQSLDPQLAEARRAAEITRMTNAGRLVGSGAFGGGRQAIMEAEGDRNLGTNLANITGQGYNTAYTNATQQFNQAQQQKLANDQATESSKQFGANFGMNNNVNSANFQQKANDASEQSKQYGARYGLDALTGAANAFNTAGSLGAQIGGQERANIATQMDAGGVQRGIAQDSLNGAMAKFNETAALPSKALGVKSGALQGLPITQTAAIPRTLMQDLADIGLTATQIADILGTDK